MGWYLKALMKYAVFNGRAHRTEYWMFILFNVIIAFGLVFIDGFFGITPVEIERSIVGTIYELAVFIPTIAAGARRLHDSGRSGWWQIVPVVNWVFMCTPSTQGENGFGPDPRDS